MADVRALLLTDVVDSTRLAEQLGDAAMAELWARHDRVARDLLRPHGGREIDKTDGFLFLFAKASEAVAYAAAYHRALEPLGLKARAGLHVGPVILTENRPEDVALGAKPLEVDGLAKPTAARVMGLACGGQTLLTAEARAALGDTSLRVESHGQWRMKGISAPVELFEVGEADAPFVPPPDGAKVYRVVCREGVWLPVKQVPHGLPAERDAFVGREADLQDLSRRLDDGARLVSVLGVGGTGKTRLVLRFAWTWLGDWPGGAWFCDLSEARSVEGIAAAVARALDVPLGQGDPVVQLGHAIAARGRCLVVLDNFEQVARFASETVGRWLDRARDAQFVVTSREILGLAGETALALAPLVDEDAVDLFVARAAQAKRDFALTEAERSEVVSLVRLSDGLPLAIELAAARVRVMPPKMILQRMSERFKLLASSGGRHTRQATLRATLDWSWDLLSADEQRALAQLSVFEGGFTLEAAEQVLALQDAWPVDAVQALVDKSLVRRMSEERFDLLVSVREYASEKLAAVGGRAEAEARHGAWFGSLSKEAATADGGIEFDNLAAACGRAADRGDAPSAVRALKGAWDALSLRGPYAAAEALLARVGAIPDPGARERVQLERIRGTVARNQGRLPDAEARYRAALDGARALGDREAEGDLHHLQGQTLWQLSRYPEAAASLEEAGRIAREIGREALAVAATHDLGNLYFAVGRHAEARAASEQAFARECAVGNRRAAAASLSNLSLIARAEARHEDARALQEESLALALATGDRNLEAGARGNLALILCDLRAWDEAAAELEAGKRLSAELGYRTPLMQIHLTRAVVAAARGEPAAVYDSEIAAALVVARECGARRYEGHIVGYHGRKLADQGDALEAEAPLAEALAIAREVGDGHLELATLAYLAEVRCQRGDTEGLLAFVEAALERAAQVGWSGADAMLHRRRATLLARAGRTDEALAALALASETPDRTGQVEAPLHLAVARAEVAARSGRIAEAREALAQAEVLAAARPAKGARFGDDLARVAALLGGPVAEGA